MCFPGISFLINILANTADAVAAHTGFAAVGVENAHFEVRNGGLGYPDHTIGTGTEMPLRQLDRECGRVIRNLSK